MFARAMNMGRWIAAAVMVGGLAACASPTVVPPPLPPTPPSPAMTLRGQLVQVTFADLPGWRNDTFEAALTAFGRSCEYFSRHPDRWDGTALGVRIDEMDDVCKRRHSFPDHAAREYFESYFVPYRVGAVTPIRNTLTAYASPRFAGHMPPCAPGSAPLYRKPPRGEYSREEISRGALKGREIACVDDPVDAFDLQIQGAGSLHLPNGGEVYLATEGTNGMPPKMPSELGVTMGQLRQLSATDRGAAIKIMNGNPRYTYYVISSDSVVRGAMGKPLTPRRSMAVDSSILPYGLPIWLDAQGSGQPTLQRLMFAHDTGSKIRGVSRGDYYMGAGSAAMDEARRFKMQTATYILLPHRPFMVQAPAGRPASPGPFAAVASPAPAMKAAEPAGAFVQLGVFSAEQSAQRHLDQVVPLPLGPPLSKQVEPVAVQGGARYRALVTGFTGEAAAVSYCSGLRARGIECLAKLR